MVTSASSSSADSLFINFVTVPSSGAASPSHFKGGRYAHPYEPKCNSFAGAGAAGAGGAEGAGGGGDGADGAGGGRATDPGAPAKS